MNSKAMKALEFPKIVEMLLQKAASPMGKAMCNALKPMNFIDDIARALKETTEAAGFILRKGSLPLGGIRDIRSSLSRAAVGGVLTIEELLNVCDFLYVCRKIITY
ncbi:MAG: endonuclease MutS2, partial [Clostridiales bacterium]|nr:endonuclease MutS2 [Clostridiales bacterium]